MSYFLTLENMVGEKGLIYVIGKKRKIFITDLLKK